MKKIEWLRRFHLYLYEIHVLHGGLYTEHQKNSVRCRSFKNRSSPSIFHRRFIRSSRMIRFFASAKTHGSSVFPMAASRRESNFICSSSARSDSERENTQSVPHLGHFRRSDSPVAGHPFLQTKSNSRYSPVYPQLWHVISMTAFLFYARRLFSSVPVEFTFAHPLQRLRYPRISPMGPRRARPSG